MDDQKRNSQFNLTEALQETLFSRCGYRRATPEARSRVWSVINELTGGWDNDKLAQLQLILDELSRYAGPSFARQAFAVGLIRFGGRFSYAG